MSARATSVGLMLVSGYVGRWALRLRSEGAARTHTPRLISPTGLLGVGRILGGRARDGKPVPRVALDQLDVVSARQWARGDDDAVGVFQDGDDQPTGPVVAGMNQERGDVQGLHRLVLS